MEDNLQIGYQLKMGSLRDSSLLNKFMYLMYQELFPHQQDFSHLTETVNQYFSPHTPLWFVKRAEKQASSDLTVACLWMGNAIDQVIGERYAHIFLIFVLPEYRKQGIGTYLIKVAENWAKARGDRQIGLQVFTNNQPALSLYSHLGFQAQSLSMIKPLFKIPNPQVQTFEKFPKST
ncbi:MAG: GNAT family N-acetyltransferase [Xenococcaceae cyanobacterium MO_188.B32]|nr:GNAT family N-acetyltransferase [Xenococcaceae cyanobacterium MO_188.B32]